MGLEWDKRYHEHERQLPSDTPISRPYFVIGLLSQPGGGVIENQSAEALKYQFGNGSEVDFPYFTVGSDSPHDFVTSNVSDDPTNNSAESDEGFDKENTTALIRLLLAQPRVTKIELDPYLLDLVPGIKDDPRVVPHGSRDPKDTARRDMDNHMFVTFSNLTVDLDIDSDNNGTLDRTPGEDKIEDQQGTGGKFVPPNAGTTVAGIPDYADGFDVSPDLAPARCVDGASAHYTPMMIQFPDDVDLANAEFDLIYSESDPSDMKRSSTDPNSYELPHTGVYRVWTIDGDKARLKAQIPMGNFIKSGIRYPVSALGELAGRTKRLYIESVEPSLTPNQRDVVFEFYPRLSSYE